jgi:hypothetical protein
LFACLFLLVSVTLLTPFVKAESTYRALPRISVKDVANRLYGAKTGNEEVENIGIGFDDGSVFRNSKKDHRACPDEISEGKTPPIAIGVNSGRKREKPSLFIHNDLDNFAILMFRAFAIDSWSSDGLI